MPRAAAAAAHHRRRGGSLAATTSSSVQRTTSSHAARRTKAVTKIFGRQRYALEDTTVPFESDAPRRPACAAARRDYAAAARVLREGRVAEAIPLLDVAADPRQPETVRLVRLAKAARDDLGPKVTAPALPPTRGRRCHCRCPCTPACSALTVHT